MDADPEKISSTLSWKEFEIFVELAFSNSGYQTELNQRWTKPRMEIDLFASDGKLAFAVDCKHWKRTVGKATMLRVGEKQVVRSKRILEAGLSSKVMPMIVTLHDEMLQVLDNGVPVVPIYKLSDFLTNWEALRDQLQIIEE